MTSSVTFVSPEKYIPQDFDKCGICLDPTPIDLVGHPNPVNRNRLVCLLHRQCAKYWIIEHRTCPTCRSPVDLKSSTILKETPLEQIKHLGRDILEGALFGGCLQFGVALYFFSKPHRYKVPIKILIRSPFEGALVGSFFSTIYFLGKKLQTRF